MKAGQEGELPIEMNIGKFGISISLFQFMNIVKKYQHNVQCQTRMCQIPNSSKGKKLRSVATLRTGHNSLNCLGGEAIFKCDIRR